ncbi:hypothetical protein [Bacillus atrophaeus]|nr:hypothetical protein [Bacillus atrophaeus]
MKFKKSVALVIAAVMLSVGFGISSMHTVEQSSIHNDSDRNQT